MSFKPIYKLRDWINPELLVHNDLSRNPCAIHILEKNLDKINWCYLSANPGAIDIIEQNLDEIVWDYLSLNKAATHLLEKNLDKVDWVVLSANPNAINLFFKYDYQSMKQNNKNFFEELVKKVFNPKRLISLCNRFNIDWLDYTDILNTV
jgi:hypothetical protein